MLISVFKGCRSQYSLSCDAFMETRAPVRWKEVSSKRPSGSHVCHRRPNDVVYYVWMTDVQLTVKSPEFPMLWCHDQAFPPFLLHLKHPLALDLRLDRTHSSVHKLSDAREPKGLESSGAQTCFWTALHLSRPVAQHMALGRQRCSACLHRAWFSMMKYAAPIQTIADSQTLLGFNKNMQSHWLTQSMRMI